MVELDQGGAHAHAIVRSSIPTDLADLVSSVTIHEGGGPDWKIVADDAPHLVFSVSTAPGGAPAGECRLALVGARSRAVVCDHRTRRLTAVLRFRPGALPAVFGLPGSELADRDVDLADLMFPAPNACQWTAGAFRSHQPLVKEMLHVVRSAHRRTGGGGIDWRVRVLLAGDHRGGQISEAAARTAVSVRTLRRVVLRATGLSPMRLLRIRRLHRALLVARSGAASWSRVAANGGYADESHLARDCRDLLGEPPAAFLRRRCG